jgi:NADH-quinone oxidoreductase subunit L
MDQLAIFIPLFPLISFLIIALLGKKVPKIVISSIAVGSVIIAFFISFIILFTQIQNQHTVQINLFDWITVVNFKVSFAFLVDPLTSIFLCVITGVGSLIHLYSVGYMHDEEDYARFFSYLNLFVFFMLILVLANNLLLMFVGWEGVGLCSYLLIGFWYKNQEYSKAANKAFIMNRIGDLGFLLGIFLTFGVFGSLNFTDIFTNTNEILQNGPLITAITLLLFIGAMGKSAQIPLYTWLPDAMAGPTPVSALIHAATMVTAGIYLIARCNVLFSSAIFTSNFIAIIGVATSLLAAIIAMQQNDIKKVLAYSTVSQLGLIFLALGVGAYTAGAFHVVTHAFFKALLFLGAGSVIHGMGGEQDIRKMGGLKSGMPITHITFLIGTIAISGIPPLAGFFSKDQMLASVYDSNKILFVLGLVASLMTSFYMFRLYFLTFQGKFRGTEDQKHHLHESPISMTLPLIKLAFLSIFSGLIGFPHELGKALGIPNFLDHFLEHSIHPKHLHINLNTEMMLMAVTTVLILIVIFFARHLFVTKQRVPLSDEDPMPLAKEVIYNKFYVDELYQIFIVKPIFSFSRLMQKFVEKLGINGFINSVADIIIKLGNALKITQSGATSKYIIVMVLAMVIFIIYKFYFLIYNLK